MNAVSELQVTPAECAQRAFLSGMLANSANARHFGSAWQQANQRDHCNKLQDESMPRDAAQEEPLTNANASRAVSAQARTDTTQSSLRALDQQAQQVAACLQALSGIRTHFGAATSVASTQCGSALQAERARELRALTDRCVRFALLADSEVTNDARICIVVAPELFPDTEFLLQRCDTGWRLDAHSFSVECAQLLANGAGALQEKFAARGLGQIVVSIVTE